MHTMTRKQKLCLSGTNKPLNDLIDQRMRSLTNDFHDHNHSDFLWDVIQRTTNTMSRNVTSVAGSVRGAVISKTYIIIIV